MLCSSPTRTGAVSRADPELASPTYQITVLAAVPAVSVVAPPADVPPTRSGGLVAVAAKKFVDVAIVEAEASSVVALDAIAVWRAAPRLVMVSASVGPIAKVFWPVPPAVSVSLVVVPSGRFRPISIVSPAVGCAPASTAAGGGPAEVAAVRVVLVVVAVAIFIPKGRPAVSSARVTSVAVVATVRRPRPAVPRSAALRSETSCFSPACPESPSMISEKGCTGFVSPERPENR